MPYVGKKPADIIATAVDTTTGKFSGEIDAASLDISGDIDVDGTTNLDVVDIDGAVDMASTLGVAGVTTLGSTLSATKISTGTTDNPNSSPLYIRCATDDNIRIGQETHAAIGAVNNAANAFVDLKIDASNLFLNSQSAGFVTMPNQPAFLVHPSSDQTNIAGSSGGVTVVFGTERFDQNADFASNTFTAPVAGKYQLNASIYLNNVDSAGDFVYMAINTSNQAHYFIIDPDFGQDSVYWSLQGSVLTDMDANDTANIQIVQHTSTVQMDINQNSRFSGYLVA